MDDFCNKELLKKIADAGCVSIGVGIETLNKKNIIAIKKPQNMDKDVKESLDCATSLGMSVCAFIIFGLEHDTEKSLAESIDKFKKLPFSFYDVCILRVLPGSKLYDNMLKNKEVIKDWWLIEDEPYYNDCLPGYLRVYYKPARISPEILQELSVYAIKELNSLNLDYFKLLLRYLLKGNFTLLVWMIYGRYRLYSHASKQLKAIEIFKKNKTKYSMKHHS